MQEKISALMDGELDAGDASAMIEQFKNAEELREYWIAYHLISDALGQSEVKPLDITRRVNARLVAEPAVFAVSSTTLPYPAPKRRPRAYAAAASIAAAMVGGWIILQTTQEPDLLRQNLADNRTSPSTSAATTLAPVATYPAIPAKASIAASESAQINDYLLAHQQFSPSTTMHGAIPFMRTAAESAR
ncbi:sigma-E factor negative regulatory protein [Nitrosospira multiformis]|uniref:Anti sigma-E protein, RseA n=1 Tax=Nitrosospira multiformis (strain ATCC 25196 / NCIMB 11849 / C 71) TaxID=323848 RepID=Q2Y877_NITMU|nr:sigma-E factor negative regulatory protein [Nitrosospira multiformis]ABB75044.1 anti sigma-E protein, RseA [Nitrosospira multiformis ATCC 25196]SEA55511.1 anti sigma-E protein, RseA [Nitrosospira multiformis]SEF83978.1 anti sigma-E protein, RseA [Nitrosospira multiformis ATCC 25196]